MVDIRGTIRITDDGWSWVPTSLRNGDVNGLINDLMDVTRINPAFGKGFYKHIEKAYGCRDYVDDTQRYAKCVIGLHNLSRE